MLGYTNIVLNLRSHQVEAHQFQWEVQDLERVILEAGDIRRAYNTLRLQLIAQDRVDRIEHQLVTSKAAMAREGRQRAAFKARATCGLESSPKGSLKGSSKSSASLANADAEAARVAATLEQVAAKKLDRLTLSEMAADLQYLAGECSELVSLVGQVTRWQLEPEPEGRSPTGAAQADAELTMHVVRGYYRKGRFITGEKAAVPTVSALPQLHSWARLMADQLKQKVLHLLSLLQSLMKRRYNSPHYEPRVEPREPLLRRSDLDFVAGLYTPARPFQGFLFDARVRWATRVRETLNKLRAEGCTTTGARSDVHSASGLSAGRVVKLRRVLDAQFAALELLHTEYNTDFVGVQLLTLAEKRADNDAGPEFSRLELLSSVVMLHEQLLERERLDLRGDVALVAMHPPQCGAHRQERALFPYPQWASILQAVVEPPDASESSGSGPWRQAHRVQSAASETALTGHELLRGLRVYVPRLDDEYFSRECASLTRLCEQLGRLVLAILESNPSLDHMSTPLPIEAYLTYRHLLRLQLSLQVEYEAHEGPNAFRSVHSFVALETLLADLRLKLQGLQTRTPDVSNVPPIRSPSVPPNALSNVPPNALAATAAPVAPRAPAPSLSPAVRPNIVPDACLTLLSAAVLHPTDSDVVVNTTASDLASDTASVAENSEPSPQECTFAAHVEELLGLALPPVRAHAAVATSMAAMGMEPSAEVCREKQPVAAAANTQGKWVSIDAGAAPAVSDMIARFDRMSCAEAERQRALEKEREKKRRAQAQATTSGAQNASVSTTAVSCTSSKDLLGAEEAAIDSASATWTQLGPEEERESGEGAQGASAEPSDVNEIPCGLLLDEGGALGDKCALM